jgi:plastocyanin
MPLIRGDQVTWRTDFATEHLQGWSGDIPSYCGVRNDAGYSYVKYSTGEEELYDLNQDPYQLASVVQDPGYATVLAQLRARAPVLCNPPPPGMTFSSTPPHVTIDSGPIAITSSTSATFTFSSDETGVHYQCSIDGGPLSQCTSPVTYTGLSAAPHFVSVVGSDPQNFVGDAAWRWTVALPVTVADFKFTPGSVKPGLGTTILWTFNGPSNHTVTDSTGMGLFDSGPLGPGNTFNFPFTAAGVYSYNCTIHPTQMKGQAKVPMATSPQTGTVATWFTITWATVTAPAGFTYEVQIKRPGAINWSLWTSGAPTFAMFQPDGGTGTYSFRARMKNTGNNKATGWSVTKSIVVSA